MVKQKPQSVGKQLRTDDDKFYGSQTMSGHAPDPSSDDDIELEVEKVTGEEPIQSDQDRTPHLFNIGKEVNKDEQSLRNAEGQNEPSNDPMSPASSLDEEAEGHLAGVSETLASSTSDPFDLLTDADIKGLKKQK